MTFLRKQKKRPANKIRQYDGAVTLKQHARTESAHGAAACEGSVLLLDTDKDAKKVRP